MGTNYYLVEDVCECCGKGEQTKHIGKSSGGWNFGLHVDSEVKNLDDWKKIFNHQFCSIVDEYGKTIGIEEMLEIIEKRSWHTKQDKPFGYASWESFHQLNHSEEGESGLLRHQVDGHHCVGHGEGTYDYIAGEFS